MQLDTKKIGGQTTETTTAPVHATPAHVAGVDPEFLDWQGVQARFGIKRSNLYALLGEGVIRSVALRRKGCARGRRLFETASIRRFLRQQMEAGE
jgi:hypothetical protein